MIYIKSVEEIKRIRQAAELWKKTKLLLETLIIPGNTPKMLEKAAYEFVHNAGGVCTFKNYHGFPGYLCVSVNEVAIHGIANDRKFVLTDKVSVDIGISINNAVCDSGFSKIVDAKSNPSYQKLLDFTHQTLWEGINQVKPGNWTGDIAAAIEQYVKTNSNYGIIEDFTGHGCGLYLHEDPIIFNAGTAKTGTILKPNMVICIEPILTSDPSGAYYIDLFDKWSVKVKKGGQVCHWEHMVLVTEDKYDVLTASDAELHQMRK